jgi:subtilisin-like proprotein convertase family protein
MKSAAISTLCAGFLALACAGTASAETLTFAGPGPIALPDNQTPGVPYPSQINVAGLTGTIAKLTTTVTVNTSYGYGLEILLVGPAGQRVMLMGHGCSVALPGKTFTFDDSAPTLLSPPCNSGTYKPTNAGGVTTMPAPAPAGPYPTTFASFFGADPNGVWSLYARDSDATISPGASLPSWNLAMTGPATTTTTKKCKKGRKLKKVHGKKKCVKKKRKRSK